MIDLVKLLLTAGDGGNGRVSFRREKYAPKGGPDGGDGGNGGSIIIRADTNSSTLKEYAHKTAYSAEAGGLGGDQKKHGKKGDNLVLTVPVGTRIVIIAENTTARQRRTMYGAFNLFKWEEVIHKKYTLEQEGQRPDPLPPLRVFSPFASIDTSEVEIEEGFDAYEGVSARDMLQDPTIYKHELITILEPDQEVVVVQGGFGGRGNDHFKGPSQTTPLTGEYGTEGEKRLVLLELKLLADVGLVGFPNAGKSTLLSIVTKARPKIANYPFTTIEPHLGVLTSPDNTKELVVADIPGLIEGASEGKGLGLDFLRHIENTRMLLYVLSLDEVVVFDSAHSDKDKAVMLWDQYQKLQKELGAHTEELLKKDSFVAVNKSDLYSETLQKTITTLFKKKGAPCYLFSGVTSVGLDELKKQLFQQASK